MIIIFNIFVGGFLVKFLEDLTSLNVYLPVRVVPLMTF